MIKIKVEETRSKILFVNVKTEKEAVDIIMQEYATQHHILSDNSYCDVTLTMLSEPEIKETLEWEIPN